MDNEIIRWVYITIFLLPSKPDGSPDHNNSKDRILLSSYDISRESYDKRKWYINWKHSFWIVQYPKRQVELAFCFYDKKTGHDLFYGSPLGNLISMKGQLTKWRNNLNKLRDLVSQSLFQIEEHPQYIFILNKIKHYEDTVKKLETELSLLDKPSRV